jgi:hypothetical protein
MRVQRTCEEVVEWIAAKMVNVNKYRRGLTNALQLLAALLCVAALFVLLGVGVDPKWIFAGVMSLFAFSYIAYLTKAKWMAFGYWVTLLVSAVVHCAVLSFLLTHVRSIPIVFYAIVLPFEMLMVYVLVEKY